MSRSDELLSAAVETGDNAHAARLRSEARAVQGIEDAQAVLEALERLERVVGQLSRSALRAFAERAGRLYAHAVARLLREDRRAVRALVRGTGRRRA